MTKKGHRKISGGEWENFGWRNIWGLKGHRKFGVPENVMLQKSPVRYTTPSEVDRDCLWPAYLMRHGPFVVHLVFEMRGPGLNLL